MRAIKVGRKKERKREIMYERQTKSRRERREESDKQADLKKGGKKQLTESR